MKFSFLFLFFFFGGGGGGGEWLGNQIHGTKVPLIKISKDNGNFRDKEREKTTNKWAYYLRFPLTSR